MLLCLKPGFSVGVPTPAQYPKCSSFWLEVAKFQEALSYSFAAHLSRVLVSPARCVMESINMRPGHSQKLLPNCRILGTLLVRCLLWCGSNCLTSGVQMPHRGCRTLIISSQAPELLPVYRQASVCCLWCQSLNFVCKFRDAALLRPCMGWFANKC